MSASAQEQVVKIGHVGPLTGSIAHLGKDNENGARMAIDALNAKGIKLQGKKVKFELMAEDDGANPQQATSVAQKLADAKVNGVVGHLNSGTTIPASKIYHDHGIPQVSPSATNPKYTQQGYKGAFRVVANDGQLGGALGRYAASTLKVKNIAIVDDRTAYGQGVADEFAKGVSLMNLPKRLKQRASISSGANIPTTRQPTSTRFSLLSKASSPTWYSLAAWMRWAGRCCAR